MRISLDLFESPQVASCGQVDEYIFVVGIIRVVKEERQGIEEFREEGHEEGVFATFLASAGIVGAIRVGGFGPNVSK